MNLLLKITIYAVLRRKIRNMMVNEYIEYIGYEDSFNKFLELLNNKLNDEGRTVKLWCNLEFLPRIKNYKRIKPIYYKKYNNQIVSIKEYLKKRRIIDVLRELINRISHRNYVKYSKFSKNLISQCCLISNNGKLEVAENVKEKDFKGSSNTLVLRRYSEINGMFSHLMVMLPYLKWASSNDINVYFDMSVGDSSYRERNGENAWEYFYEQVNSKPNGDNGTIVSNLLELSDEYKIEFSPKHINNIIELSSVYEKYIKLNAGMSDLVDENWKKIYRGEKKILGVKFRGTDYVPDKIVAGHHFQTTCDEMIEKTENFLKRYGYEYIYVCTEEQKNLEKFEKKFGDRVRSYDCRLIDHYDGGGALSNQIALVGKRKAGEDYIGSVMCLAKCDSILCSLNSGSYMAIIINGGKYEHIEIVDKGLRN